MSRVGERIKEERVKKGMTAKQLGKKCGVAESFILDMESGRKIINEKLLAQISKVLEVDLEEKMAAESVKVEENEQESKENKTVKPIVKPIASPSSTRQMVEPLDQWGDALSNIIKKVPIYDMEMKVSKGHKNFPIIDKKVEGFHPDKLIYIEIAEDDLGAYRIKKGDRGLIYLNHEWTNGAFHWIEYGGKKYLRKVKKIEGNKLQLLDGSQDGKGIIKEIKELKILGKLVRVEIDF